ncbi:hypothetical protein [Pseudomonas sp.]|uniref:hypothetical protein n=1 Tax=Pseudomonas sp. TaxID=306 RepID=UPI003FD73846
MEPLEAVDTWVGRLQPRDFPRFAENFTGAFNSLKASCKAFDSALSATALDLAGKKYGFTVEADGRLKVLDSASRLSSSDTQRLTDLLNQSPVLKAYRNASIDTVDADSVWSGLGYYSLTNENFAKTIDLAPLLRDFDPSDIKGPRPINWPTKASGRRKKRKWRCMSGVQRSGSVRRADPLCVVRNDGVQAAVDTQNHYMGFWSIRLWSAGLHRHKKAPPHRAKV